jgi:hypothetical protein
LVGETLYELEPAACPVLPCTLDDALVLYSTATAPGEEFRYLGHWTYTANGLGVYFHEYGLSTGPGDIRRLDLRTGPPFQSETVLTVLADGPPPNNVAYLAAKRGIDPGLDTVLLFDDQDDLYLLDTRAGGAPQRLGPGFAGRWSPDDSKVLFLDQWRATKSYNSGEVKMMDLTTFAVQRVLKYAIQPDWAPPVVEDVGCTVDADCEDGNSCTTDLCNTDSGECSNSPVADNTSCGINGWCTSGICFEPECGVAGLECDDGNICTVDSCLAYECLFDTAAAAGFSCDDGNACTVADECDGAGVCAGVFDATIPGCGCLPRGVLCSADDECCSGSCHPVKGTCK